MAWQAGERVLIHGAAGGVGQFATQLARHRGAHVIGTASSDSVERARALGADEVVDHTAESFTDVVEPVDLVFDTAGGERLERSPTVLRPGGRLVSIVEEPPETGAGAAGSAPSTSRSSRAARSWSSSRALVDGGELDRRSTASSPSTTPGRRSSGCHGAGDARQGRAPGIRRLATERDFARIERGGVRTLRVLVRWRRSSPKPGPSTGAASTGSRSEAGAHGVELLPFVYGSPEWVAEPESRPPLDSPAARDAWRSFLTRLVDRYRAGGELAAAGAAPIRRWQVWNEPNFDFYWSPAPTHASTRGYSGSPRARSGPPTLGARVITAGLAPVAAGTEWSAFLRRLYRVRGFRKSFDALALHPYAVQIEGLRARSPKRARSWASTATAARRSR